MTKVILDVGWLFRQDAVRRARIGDEATSRRRSLRCSRRRAPSCRRNFKIDPAQLARYAGTYRNTTGNELTFAVVDGKLTGGPSGQQFTLAATDETSFRIVGAQGVSITFQLEGGKPDGKVTGLALKQGDNTTNYARVEGK